MTVDDLFQLPLAQFTDARNDLSKVLRRGGDRDAANRVKGLRKPSITAWAINQVYWRHRPIFEALVEAGTALHSAHREALEGGAASALSAATARQRQAQSAAVAAATEALEAAGNAVTLATTRRLTRTLEAVAADRNAAGRLTQDLEPAGFDALVGLGASRRPTLRLIVSPAVEEEVEPTEQATPEPRAEDTATSESEAAERLRRVRGARTALAQAEARASIRKVQLADAQRAEAAVQERLAASRRDQAEAETQLLKAERRVAEARARTDAAKQALAALGDRRAGEQAQLEAASGAVDAAQRLLAALEEEGL